MDIEDVSKEYPEKIAVVHIDPVLGLHDFHFNFIAQQVNFDKELISQLRDIIKKLYGIFVNHDCLTVEINPLALLEDGSFVALIGQKAGFVVIKLSGSVSIISNGAGTAIATLDMLSRYDTNVANMLDLSGGATSEKVMRAVEVVTQDKDVKAIIFNIFGGITRCDEIATGVIGALKTIPDTIPIVCRLNGTNRDLGVQILQDSGLEAESDLEKAVRKTVDLMKDT